MTAEELLAQLQPPRFYNVGVSIFWAGDYRTGWIIGWRRRGSPGGVRPRRVLGGTLAEAVAAALAWEADNDRNETEDAT